jgi:hypothetical protein
MTRRLTTSATTTGHPNNVNVRSEEKDTGNREVTSV